MLLVCRCIAAILAPAMLVNIAGWSRSFTWVMIFPMLLGFAMLEIERIRRQNRGRLSVESMVGQ